MKLIHIVVRIGSHREYLMRILWCGWCEWRDHSERARLHLEDNHLGHQPVVSAGVCFLSPRDTVLDSRVSISELYNQNTTSISQASDCCEYSSISLPHSPNKQYHCTNSLSFQD